MIYMIISLKIHKENEMNLYELITIIILLLLILFYFRNFC